MDTKWKDNKKRSIGIAFSAVLILTAIFMSFFPFFEKRADSEFENPLTGNSFINMLYQSNFIQYKYLKEKADQKTYSYADLYVEDEYLSTYDESIDNVDMTRDVPLDAIQGSSALEEQVHEFKENSLRELNQMRSSSSELTQLLDYYAVDKKTGASIGNSSTGALKEIVDGKTPEDNPYVYYVYMSYDSAGNVENCGVSASGNVGEFLKKVESLGREQYFDNYYGDDGSCFVGFYNMEREEWYRYRLSIRRPSDMKIIYAMTSQQYQTLLNGKEDLYNTYYFMPEYALVSQNSYYRAGVPRVVAGFFTAAMLLGAFCVFFFNRKQKDAYIYQTLKLCRLPLEVDAFLVILGIAFAEKLVDLICAYQKGGFLPNLTKHILAPVHLEWVGFVIVCVIFFLYFLLAFTLGSNIPGLFSGKEFYKKNTLIYRYWDKIITLAKSFYQELVDFDIGSDAKKIIRRLVIVNFLILWVITLFWVWGFIPLLAYSLLIYFLMKKYVKDVQNKYQNLLWATSSIAKGDFDIALSEDFGVFESYKNELRQIQTDFKKAVSEEVKSQRMKSELITNVSHDLKTPLTAIITYINLLKEPGITDEQRQEYIATLDKKAVRLKVLIEDLFEVSKATTNNITLNYDKVDICNLLRQCYLEYEDRMEENQLQFKFLVPEEKIVLTLDPQKTFRIFENLYTNIIKYALPATRVYVIVREKEGEVEIEVKNISRTELQISPEELTERFVRGDGARNTEGSGLGLAIARSFTEIQHGSMQISVDGDLFKVLLIFRKWDTPLGPPGNDVTDHAGEGGSATRMTQNSPVQTAFQNDSSSMEPQQPFYHPSRWRTEKNLRKNRRREP